MQTVGPKMQLAFFKRASWARATPKRRARSASKVAARLHAAGKHALRISALVAGARTPLGPSAVFDS
jgi:hypothetical protein